MNPEQALAYWSAHINYEQRTPGADDLKLDRLRALLARVGNPHHRVRAVHVAGSKGKGSTSAMLASILRHAGHRTGLFTSPHLTRLEERFQIDGEPITLDELAAALTDLAKAERKSAPPTFFELATAAGFLHFLRRRVDVAVLEVGLGGRLDSTNVCRPAASVITSISLDHTQVLGDTLGAIASEKAGIVKPGRPVISGATHPEAASVIAETCRARRAPLFQLGRDFHAEGQAGHLDADGGLTRPTVRVTTRHRAWPEMPLNLLGRHQAANAALAVVAVEQLRSQGWHIPDRAVAEGLARVNWPARIEILGRAPWRVLDCSHNVASVAALADALAESFPPGRRLLVFAGSADKDIPGMFGALQPHFDRAFLTRFTNNPRAVPPEQLAGWWQAAGPHPCTTLDTPEEAWAAALQASGPADLVCATGSVFLAGQLRASFPTGAV